MLKEIDWIFKTKNYIKKFLNHNLFSSLKVLYKNVSAKFYWDWKVKNIKNTCMEPPQV
jgi:hypothetical protein